MKDRIPLLTTIGGMLVGYVLICPLSVYVSHRVHQEEALRQIRFWEVFSHESKPFIGKASSSVLSAETRKG